MGRAELFLFALVSRHPLLMTNEGEILGSRTVFVLIGSRQAGVVGFEPTGVSPPLVFKTSAIVRSAIPPWSHSKGGLYDLGSPDGDMGALAFVTGRP